MSELEKKVNELTQALDNFRKGSDILQGKMSEMREDTSGMQATNEKQFGNVTNALMQFGNIIDVLYLEVAVLLDLLSQKNIISPEEFKKTMEDTSKEIEKRAKEEMNKTPGSNK